MAGPRVIRVFPRRTAATPEDDLTRVGFPRRGDRADEVRISVAFTWDLPRADVLAEAWGHIAPVTIGGPATGQRGAGFTPGEYLRPGYVITSRGCPNRCWFCSVPRREGPIRELAIAVGWNVLDDNLLACSEAHIRAVFRMLAQRRRRVEFTGGLEAARLQPWHVDLLASLRPRPAVWFAYDSEDDLEPLIVAGRMLRQAGFTRASHRVRCYVLIGQPGDTLEAARLRLLEAWRFGFLPMAMLWRDPQATVPEEEWRRFQGRFARPARAARLLADIDRPVPSPQLELCA